MDIVEWLRAGVCHDCDPQLAQAADEIERLRREVERLEGMLRDEQDHP